MEGQIKILRLEDSETDADLLVRHLRKEKINFVHNHVWKKDTFLEQLSKFSPDLVIADYSLPHLMASRLSD